MRMLIGAAAALALMGTTGAQAQIYVAEPAPVYAAPAPYYAPAPYSPAPVVVAPPAVVAPPVAAAPPAVVAPGYVASDYAYAPAPYTGSTIVNTRTGRSCTIQPDGYRWCWTP
jgi:hypothetical protein